MTPDEGAVVKPALTEDDLAALREISLVVQGGRVIREDAS